MNKFNPFYCFDAANKHLKYVNKIVVAWQDSVYQQMQFSFAGCGCPCHVSKKHLEKQDDKQSASRKKTKK